MSLPPRSPRVIRVRLALGALAVAGALAGCGGEDAVADDPDLEARVARADTVVGEGVYRDICAACHGPEGQGGIGAALTGLGDRLSVSEIHDVVTDGRGRMPAWGNRLDPEEIDAVVAYVDQTFPG